MTRCASTASNGAAHRVDKPLDTFIQTCRMLTLAQTAGDDLDIRRSPAPGRDLVLDRLEPLLEPWTRPTLAKVIPRSSSGHHLLKHADQFFERLQPGEKLNVDDLAAALGISRRSVFHAFRTHYGIGPRRYLELKRLYALRARLRKADRNATSVSRQAGDLGFDDLGRMARRYHELFNEFPRETLQRAG